MFSSKRIDEQELQKILDHAESLRGPLNVYRLSKESCIISNPLEMKDHDMSYFTNARDYVPLLVVEVRRLKAAAEKAIEMAVGFGGFDGAHHKDWVIDQMVRALAGDKYEQVVKDACLGEDGPNTYSWSVGIAP